MAITDYPPSRLGAAVAAIGAYIAAKVKATPDDLAGIVVFNSRATVLCAECTMRDAWVGFLGSLGEVEPSNGTCIATGLRKAGTLLPAPTDGIQNRLVLLTDGHGGWPQRRAQALKDRDVVIDVIGIGGSPSEVNERCLKAVASTVNGELRYRFIDDKALLVEHFRRIADALVRV